MLNTNICVQYLTKPYNFIKPYRFWPVDKTKLYNFNFIYWFFYIIRNWRQFTSSDILYLQYDFKEIIDITEIQTKAL